MKRLTLFCKGNLDIASSLHSFRVGGQLQWNGINEIVRARYPSIQVRVCHETFTRSDALLEVADAVPAELQGRKLELGAYSAASQFSRAVFHSDADAVVLSVLPDLMTALFQHRRDGYRFFPDDWRRWGQEDRIWFRSSFAPLGLLDAQQSMENFAAMIQRIRAHTKVPILIFNASAVAPGDTVHCHAGIGEIYSTRARRFNLALAELSQRTGISIIDVDALVARAGADRLKLDAIHLNADGWRCVAQETVRVLEDLALFSPHQPEP